LGSACGGTVTLLHVIGGAATRSGAIMRVEVFIDAGGRDERLRAWRPVLGGTPWH
jgi:hypothetical protein